MWHCPYKFAFDYWAVKKDGKIVYTVFKEEEVKPLKDGETVEKLKYEGCPKFRNHISSFPNTAPAPKPKVFKNVINDF